MAAAGQGKKEAASFAAKKTEIRRNFLGGQCTQAARECMGLVKLHNNYYVFYFINKHWKNKDGFFVRMIILG